MSLYDVLFRRVLTRLDPERAHAIGSRLIRAAGRPGIASIVYRFCRPDPILTTRALGMEFPSPFGIAAGFDKEGVLVDGLEALGFGFVEVGTVTPRPQPGNPRPRLYRLPADRALINRLGFNSPGPDAVRTNLRSVTTSRIVIGVNIGKNRDTGAADAVRDYELAARGLKDVAEYFVINVSSPNTPGLRELQRSRSLEPIIRATQEAAPGVPLLVKISPDMLDDEVDAIADLVAKCGIAGVVATNTSVGREGLRTPKRIVEAYGGGGLSGPVLKERSIEVLHRLRARLPEDAVVISVGGVETARDVIARLEAGATLVQGYTGFVYRGPLWARRMNRELAAWAHASRARGTTNDR